MKRTIILRDETYVQEAIDAINSLEELHEVEIRPYKANRSAAQNRLLHKWFGEISEETGEMPDEVKERYKRRFLIDIFRRRDDSEYEETIQALKRLSDAGGRKDAVYLYDQIVQRTHTSDATVDEMVEFMNYIEIDAAQNGITLSRPEDLYRQSLGG